MYVRIQCHSSATSHSQVQLRGITFPPHAVTHGPLRVSTIRQSAHSLVCSSGHSMPSPCNHSHSLTHMVSRLARISCSIVTNQSPSSCSNYINKWLPRAVVAYIQCMLNISRNLFTLALKQQLQSYTKATACTIDSIYMLRTRDGNSHRTTQ